MHPAATLQFLEDRWDDATAAKLDEPELLRYRSNLLGSDLRITNFAGGNTSSKVEMSDPLTGQSAQVLWVKGSGGDLGTMRRSGLATLYLDKLLALEARYPGAAEEDSMVELYPLCTFGVNPTVASIDTPLHGFLPFPHVDHLHPDWAIAVAAAANGRAKTEEFNREFGHRLVWVPWYRPGFELAMMLRRAVEDNPGCDGLVLGGHGLFTWGRTQRDCYRNTLSVIDNFGQFVQRHIEQRGDRLFGGAVQQPRADRRELAQELLPFLRGSVSQQRRMIASWSDAPEVLRFVNARDGVALAYLGTSCPDHFIRTKIRPLFVPAEPNDDAAALKKKIAAALDTYRAEYAEYYRAHAQSDSPAMRDPNPAVVLIPGIGMFSFGKSRTEARIVGEFYINAIHVMEGATALGDGVPVDEVPQSGPAAPHSAFRVHTNYVALPPLEAFRIEYWSLEDAKLRRQPPEKELSRRVVIVSGPAARAAAVLAAERGAHVVVAHADPAAAESIGEAARAIAGKEAVTTANDVASAVREAIARFGGVDMVIAEESEAAVAREAKEVFANQQIGGSILLTDCAADRLRRRVDELSSVLGSQVRVNGVAAPSASDEAVARAALFLAGPQADSMRGQIVMVQ